MVRIDLGPVDMTIIHQVAELRQARYADVPSNYGTERTITKDIAGVAGEWAVHLYTGLEWTGQDNDYGADVGDLEVRTRRSALGRLCLHDKELERKNYHTGQRFVLARYRGDHVILAAANRGLIMATDRTRKSARTDDHGHGQRLTIWRSL
jgi:hypothetical protein